ncbi:MAG: NADH:flavin oxidoreductase [Sporomusaceae bacterium]|nr:NADH:flavin oxidoreductase [Sporomusaceae bacterium]
MKSLFDSVNLAGMSVKNRLIRSATYEGMANQQGHLTQDLFQLYEDLAKGEAGIIITSVTAVSPREKWIPWQLGIDNDSFIEEYKKLTDTVHEYGAKIIMQIGAIGAQTMDDNNPDRAMKGPSAVTDIGYGTTPLTLEQEEILAFEEEFAAAAWRAKQAGFDGVQVHAAHGYLLSKFLTPYYNLRADQYGGSIENRSRFLVETFQRIRERVGVDYPILLKINADDFMEDGMSFEECKYVCQKLQIFGLSAVELSGGSRSSRQGEGYSRPNPRVHSYFFSYAKELQQEVAVPVIAVGGNRDFVAVTNLLNESEIDFFSFARPLIRERNLFSRWKSGDTAPALCISCNRCSKFGNNHCIFNEK